MSKIEIYTKNICVFCDRAKNFFQHRNLSYVEYNIDENPKTPTNFNVRGIPTLLINRDLYKGDSWQIPW